MKLEEKDKIIAILERILSYAEFKQEHLAELELFAEKLKELRDDT